jgi:acyl-CoA thioesterase
VPRTDPSIDFSKVQRMLRDDLASAHLGMEVTELHLGTATVTMPVTRHMCQGHGTCHGGYIMTVADTAFAAACNSHGPVTVASAVQISYLAPAHDGDLLTARAREVSRWGRNGLYDVEVTNDKEVVIAQFRGTSRTIERESR